MEVLPHTCHSSWQRSVLQQNRGTGQGVAWGNPIRQPPPLSAVDELRLKPGTQIFPPTCKNGLKTTDSATSLLHFTEHGFRLCSQRQATILPTIYFYLITPSWLEMQEPVGKLQPTTFHEWLLYSYHLLFPYPRTGTSSQPNPTCFQSGQDSCPPCWRELILPFLKKPKQAQMRKQHPPSLAIPSQLRTGERQQWWALPLHKLLDARKPDLTLLSTNKNQKGFGFLFSSAQRNLVLKIFNPKSSKQTQHF